MKSAGGQCRETLSAASLPVLPCILISLAFYVLDGIRKRARRSAPALTGRLPIREKARRGMILARSGKKS
ncbi:hypothetical protein [uncultured Bilophila sp.]|uniref:hypothetical protein n=1 Tax=uncultured Bilophila sp. TaxID=529385 RepID=UPI00280A6D3A|nr:hypothetical protein [uncultured Bilophila sp.]